MADELIRCGVCGQEPPFPLTGQTQEEAARAAGFNYQKIRGGQYPIYRWECSTCLKMFKRTEPKK